MSEPDPPPGTVDLNIEELVLHGFPAADRHKIAGAMQRELSRLLRGDAAARAAGGEAAHYQMADHVNAGSLAVAHAAAPDAVGRQVARAVHLSMATAPRTAGGAS